MLGLGTVAEPVRDAGHRFADLAGDDVARAGIEARIPRAPAASANLTKSNGAKLTPYSGLPRNTICSHLIRPSVFDQAERVVPRGVPGQGTTAPSSAAWSMPSSAPRPPVSGPDARNCR